MATNSIYAADQTYITYPVYNAAWNSLKVPDYTKRIQYKYGRENLTGFMDEWGTTTYRSDSTYFHVERGRLMPTIAASVGVGAVGAGNPLTFTIASYSHTAGGMAPVQPGFRVGFKNDVYAVVTAVNTAVAGAWTVTVAPEVVTDNLSIATNEEIAVYSANLVPEYNTTQPSGFDVPGEVFSNTMQMLRVDLKATGKMLAAWSGKTSLVHGIDFRTGNYTECWYVEDLGYMHQRFLNAREVYYMTGRQITNTAQLPVTTYGNGFTGVLPAVEAGGNVMNYPAGMGFTLTDLNVMTLRMDKENSPTEYFGKLGFELYQKIQMEIKDFFPNGAVSYSAFSGGQQQAMSWGFASYATAGGYTFHLSKMPLFTNPTALGLKGSKFPGYGLFIPAAQTMDNAGNETSYIQKIHLSNCGYDRLYEEFMTGGAGWLPAGMKTTSDDFVQWTLREDFGMELFLPNHFYVAKRA